MQKKCSKNETQFRHITSDMTSTYYIEGEIESETNSDGEEVLYFDVVSDVGNKYFVVLCFEGKYITFYKSKKLNSENLVIEKYLNNGHEEYGHHHREQIHRYTLKRTR